ncbi:MAG: DNA-binding response regulator [Rhodobacterales bacterium]|nr:MAG: DNA-binding response regulator [Rhodobacterales bacterium]
MSPQAPAHLLVADPDEKMRARLRGDLSDQGFLVSLARDADHALRLLDGLEFDLLVLDEDLPGLAALCAAAPCLVLTAQRAPETGKAWLRKPFEPAALSERICAILGRHPQDADPKLLRMGRLAFDTGSGVLTREGEPVRLTGAELQLMRILASRPGKTVGRDEVVAMLGREGPGARARTIDVQVTRLRRKLEDDPRAPKYLQTVRGAGYMLVTD